MQNSWRICQKEAALCSSLSSPYGRNTFRRPGAGATCRYRLYSFGAKFRAPYLRSDSVSDGMPDCNVGKKAGNFWTDRTIERSVNAERRPFASYKADTGDIRQNSKSDDTRQKPHKRCQTKPSQQPDSALKFFLFSNPVGYDTLPSEKPFLESVGIPRC